MECAWFVPYISRPEYAVGVIVDSQDSDTGLTEYIPFPLEGDTIKNILDRGPDWLLGELPEQFPAFSTLENASEFLWQIFILPDNDDLWAVFIPLLCARYGGQWRDKHEYGYEIRGKK